MWERWRMLDGESRVTGSFVVGDGVDQTLEELFQRQVLLQRRKFSERLEEVGDGGGGKGVLKKQRDRRKVKISLKDSFKEGFPSKGGEFLKMLKRGVDLLVTARSRLVQFGSSLVPKGLIKMTAL